MSTITIEMERLRNPYTGLGQYCLQLGQALVAQQMPAGQIECYVPADKSNMFGSQMRYQAVQKMHRWLGVSTDSALWHCTHQDSAYWPRGHKTARVMTIHDLNFLERKDYKSWKKQLKMKALQRRINRCQGLVYISQFVKDWVHQHLQVAENIQERVIYNGNNLSEKVTAQARSEWQNAAPFLFSIGIHPKKNYHVALPILQANPKLQWWLAGADARGYQAEMAGAAAQLGLGKDQLVFTGSVTEAEKNWLFEHCSALIFPSLAEGFGLPVIEAMSCGKPVFLSTKTSLPEVGGVEAYYFPDFSAENMQLTYAQGMKDFLHDSGKAKRLRDRAAHFSWKKAATEYTEFYQQVLAH